VSGDDRFAHALARYLEGEGWQTTIAANERDAAHACRENKPHVMLVELEGHDIDGFELLATLRPRQRGIPSVLLTRCVGAGGVDSRVLRALGVVAVVRRPCRFGLLAGTLQGIVTPPNLAAAPIVEEPKSSRREEYAL
jgi:DNA-binding response OmpR family regulator